ncbi:MAG TPA: hypothetical protein VLS49_08240 [Usitatibacter sp.]|nr:hypothetical protein [Usitatibacter sp.]
MEAKETPITKSGEELPVEQAAQVGGGGDCTSTATVGSGGVTISSSGATAGDAMIAIYDGAVSLTSHVIETVANSTK